MFLTIDVNTSSAFRLSSIEDHSGLAAPARSKNCKLATLSDSIITYGHVSSDMYCSGKWSRGPTLVRS